MLEHPVDGRPHLADLGARIGVLTLDTHRERDLALVERQLGDPRCRRRDPVEGAQGEADDVGSGKPRQGHRDGAHDRDRDDELEDDRVDRFERKTDDDGRGQPARLGDDPVLADPAEVHRPRDPVGRDGGEREELIGREGRARAAVVDVQPPHEHPVRGERRDRADRDELGTDTGGSRIGHQVDRGAVSGGLRASGRRGELVVDLLQEGAAQGCDADDPDDDARHGEERDDAEDEAAAQAPGKPHPAALSM